MLGFLRQLDRISDAAARLGAILICVIGAMLLYEVCARYLFFAPTSWAEELSRLFQAWAIYLAAAYLLKGDHFITIDVLTRRLGTRGRKLQRLLVLLIVLAFSGIAIVWGIGIVADSLRLGRAQSGMLGSPTWIGEISIPIGFALLAVQALAELLRLFVPGAARQQDQSDSDHVVGDHI